MDNNVLDQIEQYRNDVSCDYNWYIIGRLIIIAFCLGCAGYLTCYLSEHCRQCEISWESKVMMILFMCSSVPAAMLTSELWVYPILWMFLCITLNYKYYSGDERSEDTV